MAKTKKAHKKDEESGFSELARRFKEHPFIFGGTIVLMVFIIIAFVFVPAITPTINQGGGETLVFGYYNGKPISQNARFRNVLRETARMMNFDLQGDYSLYSDTALQVWYQSFISTMMHMAILDEMKNAGYSPPKDEIDRQVALHPEFLEDGRFSIVKYNNFGKNALLTLRKNTEEDYITGKFYNDNMGLKISSAEKIFVGSMAFPERSFNMVSFPRESYPESEIKKFAAANMDLFKTVHLSRITMDSEKEAIQLLESIKNGTLVFEDAARNNSTDIDKDKGGDMGRRLAYEIFTFLQEESDRKAVTSLNTGEYSAVLKGTLDTWVFFRAEENPYGTDLEQEENLLKIRSYLEQFEGGRIENWLVALIDELLAEAQAQNMGLKEYVASLQENQNIPERFLAVQNALFDDFGPVSLNYSNMGGSQNDQSLRLFPNTLNTDLFPILNGAPYSEVFWRNAFLTPLNTPSLPFTLGNGMAVLTAVEETLDDETNTEYIANFYTWGWMYNAIGRDINTVFMGSEKFEDNFYSVFMPILFKSIAG